MQLKKKDTTLVINSSSTTIPRKPINLPETKPINLKEEKDGILLPHQYDPLSITEDFISLHSGNGKDSKVETLFDSPWGKSYWEAIDVKLCQEIFEISLSEPQECVLNGVLNEVNRTKLSDLGVVFSEEPRLLVDTVDLKRQRLLDVACKPEDAVHTEAEIAEYYKQLEIVTRTFYYSGPSKV